MDITDEKDLAALLALRAFGELGRGEFTVYAQVDDAVPETARSFDEFGAVLLSAFKQGLAAGQGRTTDLDPDLAEAHEHASARSNSGA